MTRTIAIIGAGPAGMLAALEASKFTSDSIYLIDRNPHPGRKLSATGSGRGNLTNNAATGSQYNDDARAFVQAVFDQFGVDDLLREFSSLGIYTYHTDDGWYYPISNAAANVSDLLESHLRYRGIRLVMDETVSQIEPRENTFRLTFQGAHPPLTADRLLIATGGAAAPQLGADTSLIPVIEKLGHHVLPMRPALAPINTETKPIHKLQGLRMNLELSLFDGKACLGREFGNAIFTQWGVNGPPAMNLSRLIRGHSRQQYSLQINFLFGNEETFRKLLNKYSKTKMPLQSLLKSIFPPKLIRYAMSKLSLPASMLMEDFTIKQSRKLFELLTCFELVVTGTRDFEFAQLSSGGVSLSEVNSQTLASRIVPNLFFAGEILDVQGPCGGYNLQWAFSSGVIAGRSLASE
ncbi:MAG: aminoacetone oxidase family FAD-binding enzyme [Anaerolineaceae bacterium]|nr:aminoacetone oxidase family FAD-binding enzyme [Anaerolineaceae bacterium]